MKTRTIILPIICGFIAAFLLASCKDDEEKAFSIFDIAAEQLEQTVDKNINTIQIPVNTTLPESRWEVETAEKWLKANKDFSTGEPFIRIDVDANTADEGRAAEIKVSSSVQDYVITVRQFGLYDITVEGDIQIKPTDGKANQYEPGYNIDKSMDGEFTTGTSYEESSNYHSPFGSGTRFPVTLEYYFDGTQEMDYFIYYTRSGNGNFGELEVYTATVDNPSESDYTKQGSYDFKEKNDPSKVTFKEGVKATRVKFVINSGRGGFASCDEMHFFQGNSSTQENKLLTVFKDITCSEVKEGVTEQDIQALGDNFFIDLARAIQNNA